MYVTAMELKNIRFGGISLHDTGSENIASFLLIEIQDGQKFVFLILEVII